MRKFLPVMDSLLTGDKPEGCICANLRSSYYVMDKGYDSATILSLTRD